jgi:hypothetical protein
MLLPSSHSANYFHRHFTLELSEFPLKEETKFYAHIKLQV